MTYLLDTNVVISLLNNRPPAVRTHLEAAWVAGDKIALPAVVLFELFYGASKSNRPTANRAAVLQLLEDEFEPENFDLDAARAAGEIRADLERAGQRIGEYDTLIAGQALARGMTLVTANVREFSRVQGLKLEDWSQ